MFRDRRVNGVILEVKGEINASETFLLRLMRADQIIEEILYSNSINIHEIKNN